MAIANRLWQRFVTVGGWSPHHQMSSTARPTKGHNRTLSSIIRSGSPVPHQASPKSNLGSEYSTTSDHEYRPSTPQQQHKRVYSSQSLDDRNDLSTIPDPRSRAMSPSSSDSMANPRHPDLNEEVATLSTKLINAINHQTTLDDTLSATRVELDNSRERIRQLEQQIEEQREILAGDVWVRRKAVEVEKTALLARIAEEKKGRLEVELQKKKIEQELENLTTALFEEANKMVITAKEEAKAEQEALQRKNDQIKAQLADTEGLLKSQQEQLAELKHVMEQMSAEKDEQSPPTSPGFSKFDIGLEPVPVDGILQHGLQEPLSPSYPTSFTHLLQPVLRTDLAAYSDFKDLVRTSKRLSGQRMQHMSSSSPGLTSLGMGLGSASSHIAPTNLSSTSLSTVTTPPAVSPQTPTTPASSVSTSSAGGGTLLPHLKETKFYKRVLTEDIEPTLRLDTAPGLSWLARRSVLTAMTDGTLVVEPAPPTTTGRFGKVVKPELYPCSLCGEARSDEEYLRAHCFRTSESGSAQTRYPLCKYCLVRVRSTCDFLGFLRIVKDGHWRADDEDAEKAAWTESVRLREQLFWSRIGGGVLPVNHPHHSSSSIAPSVRGERSPRPSQDVSVFEKTQDVSVFKETLETRETTEQVSEPAEELAVVAEQPTDCQTRLRRLSGEATPQPSRVEQPAVEDEVPAPAATVEQEQILPHDDAQTPMPSSNLSPELDAREVKPLSLAIPGSF
ncbi:hypothetical protein B0T22DRAFT_373377 [Podospora appendiculata]|uniref:GDP/GTP exchange factor Sec2 N-terminal domain-containing protein n=1 Tax=Podospora appendiculata TaxID=314037 RepID=A0AAE0XLI9_9PEZI|nr:hypothetical protein B0T22DRAFT_373377 [Podospora appendiculata]